MVQLANNQTKNGAPGEQDIFLRYNGCQSAAFMANLLYAHICWQATVTSAQYVTSIHRNLFNAFFGLN